MDWEFCLGRAGDVCGVPSEFTASAERNGEVRFGVKSKEKYFLLEVWCVFLSAEADCGPNFRNVIIHSLL